LKTEVETGNPLFFAEYQAERLSSGLHGSTPFEDRETTYRDLERIGFDNIEVPPEG
jgi:hypothetical protein